MPQPGRMEIDAVIAPALRPVSALYRLADDVLRRRPWTTGADATLSTIARLLTVIIVFGMAYGAVMGTFSGLAPGRYWQLLYSASKVPLLLLVTLGIGLPSYYVIGSLLGLSRDFGQAVRSILAAQAGLSVILASLAPLTALWYASNDNYASATLFNLAMFAIASLAANFLLRRHFGPLVAQRPAHRRMLWIWLVITSFVGVQMAWVLRPFLGDPRKPVEFFREDRWGNAYVVVGRLLWGMFGG